MPAYLRTSECTVCSLGKPHHTGSIDGRGGRGPTYSVFNELLLGGASDYQGAAFLVNLTLKKKRRKTGGVQQEGKDMEDGKENCLQSQGEHNKSHLEKASLPIIPVVSGTHSEQGNVGFLTERIPGVYLSTVMHGPVFTSEFKAHLWS